MPITLEQAKQLRLGQTLYHITNRNADGTPQRWRVNGKIKTWKTRPDEVKVPLKYGLYGYDYLTERNLGYLCLTEEDAYLHGPERFTTHAPLVSETENHG